MRKLFLSVLLVGGISFGLLLQSQVVDAGPLEPEGPPASSSVTLNELGDKLERLDSSKVRPVDLPDASLASSAGAVLLRVEGAVQGEIEGGVVSSGKEGAINILGFSHEVVSPRDAASGLPTGKRQHRPVSVIKPVDKSTPLLFRSLVTGEILPKCTLEFYQQDDSGQLVVYYQIDLTNATIVGISSEGAGFESVSFVYQKITWTFVEGSVTAEDDWSTPTQ